MTHLVTLVNTNQVKPAVAPIAYDYLHEPLSRAGFQLICSTFASHKISKWISRGIVDTITPIFGELHCEIRMTSIFRASILFSMSFGKWSSLLNATATSP